MSVTSKFLDSNLSLIDGGRAVKYKLDFRKMHPTYFDPEGILIFCGPQGSGKTLSAVRYIRKVLDYYPACLFCSNTLIQGYEERTVEYNGLDSLKDLENGFQGVLYFIDEIHLELNSLESENIDMDVIIELSQQRKQRKHIVGTSQVYMRMAKPLREQVKDIVLCHNYFGIFQDNKYIDGFSAVEENGKLKCDVKKRQFYFHSSELYACYDTYTKMHRYRREWKGKKGVSNYDRSN